MQHALAIDALTGVTRPPSLALLLSGIDNVEPVDIVITVLAGVSRVGIVSGPHQLPIIAVATRSQPIFITLADDLICPSALLHHQARQLMAAFAVAPPERPPVAIAQ